MLRLILIVLAVALGSLGAMPAQAQVCPDNYAVISVSGATACGPGAMPAASSAVPALEVVGGAVGSSASFMRSDAVIPRISRTTTVTTITGGTFSGAWATALSATPNIVLTPIDIGGTGIECELTAAPTTTAFQGRCWTTQNTTLNLSIITVGLTLSPQTLSAAGVPVQVFAIPPTQ